MKIYSTPVNDLNFKMLYSLCGNTQLLLNSIDMNQTVTSLEKAMPMIESSKFNKFE